MPRLGTNGGLIGPRRVATTGNASGNWALDEQCDAVRQAIWPGGVAGGAYSQSSVYSGATAASAAIMTDDSYTNTGAATNVIAGDMSWIKIDYTSSFTIQSVTIGTATNNIPGGWSRTYTEGCVVQTSNNDINWTNLFTVPTLPADGIYTFTSPSDFTAVSARYIRLAKFSGYVAASEFYASPAPVNPIPALAPVLWYDFNDQSTVTVSSGTITEIADKGSASRNLTASPIAPAYGAGINGLHCVDFGNATNSNYLRNTSATSFTIAEVYIVQETTLASGVNYNGLVGAANSEAYRAYMEGSNLQIDGFSSRFLNGSNASGNISLAQLQDPCLVRLAFTSATSVTSGFQVGNETVNHASRGWMGLIGEVIVFSSALDSTDRATVENYLSEKWGITLEGQGNG